MMRILGAIALTVFAVACQRDPERDVKPVPDSLRSPASTAAPSSEIIPLEDIAKSQPAAVSQRIANTDVTLTYSRPVARGRVLFGALVPYDMIWHPGADRATAMSVTRDIQVNGKTLPAAKYSVWTIPRPDRWTVIFSRAADVYHQPYPGENQDALRVDVTPEHGAHMETLTFYFPVVDGKDATLRLHWGEVMVPLSIQVP
jgi:hypothetical protein